MHDEHDIQILDQFRRQAALFARRHRADDELMQLLIECSEVRKEDQVLDVACGPGIVACALAPRAAQVTGLDFTPAMLEQAEALRAQRRLENVDWRQGSANELPFGENRFDLVVARFSFHHYRDPREAFQEMVRVCRSHGRILIADVAPPREVREAYDQLERQRDPSHTRALTGEEFAQIGSPEEVVLVKQKRCDLASDVEGLLASSFPPLGGAEAFRARVEATVAAGTDDLGIRAHRRGDALWFYFPVLISVWRKR